jgi:hypothetical protein
VATRLHPAPPFHRPAPVRRRRRFGVVPALLLSLARAILLVAAPVGVGAWLWFSDTFLVREIEVTTGERVPAEWVASAVAPFQGRHILGISLESVALRLAADPWVDSVRLRKELPDRLRVDVMERRPAALLRNGEDLFYVDDRGKAISPLPDGGDRQGLVVLRHSGGGTVPVAAALELVAELEGAREGWGAAVTEVSPLGEGDFVVRLQVLPFPVLLRAGTVADGLRRLPAVERVVSSRGMEMETVDLRFSRRILVQPAASPWGAAEGKATARTEG